MRVLRWFACLLLAFLFLSSACADWIAPRSYSIQLRDQPDAQPSRQFPLGTDELGRDRFSRLLYGTRVSLLLAPAAALVSILLALVFAGVAAVAGGWCEWLMTSCTDLFLSMPTLLILLTVRAMLPLNVHEWTSILITGALLSVFNWPIAARVIRADIHQALNSSFLLQARATGASMARILLRHLLPNLWPILIAQFWILVPSFVLSEANLSLLGLGVSEPMPSWGNMLRELENYSVVLHRPWMLAPLATLMISVLCLHAVLPARKEV